jgi:chromosome segregation ATPase
MSEDLIKTNIIDPMLFNVKETLTNHKILKELISVLLYNTNKLNKAITDNKMIAFGRSSDIEILKQEILDSGKQAEDMLQKSCDTVQKSGNELNKLKIQDDKLLDYIKDNLIIIEELKRTVSELKMAINKITITNLSIDMMVEELSKIPKSIDNMVTTFLSSISQIAIDKL